VSVDRRQETGSTVDIDPCHTVAQIELIALATDDVEGLRDFYLQLGAVAPAPSSDPDTGLRSCVLDFCGVRLELFEPLASGEGAVDVTRSTGLAHLGFALGSADAVDELCESIAAAGHRVLEPPHRAGELGRYESIVLDPDGNRVRLTV
jgi:lactoylglutathione lyase